MDMDWRDRLHELLDKLGVRGLPGRLSTSKIYAWDKTGRIRQPLPTGVSARARLKSLHGIARLRLLPLMIIPRLRDRADAVELLFKRHKDWKWVFPVVTTLGDDLPASPVARIRQVTESAVSGFALRSTPSVRPIGGLVSFKRSATSGEAACWLFPLYVVRAEICGAGTHNIRMKKRDYEFLCKHDLEEKAGRGRISSWPNGDVYRTLEHLFPRQWSDLQRFGRPYDLAFSFVGARARSLVSSVVGELKRVPPDKRPVLFYDKTALRPGMQLSAELPAVFLHQAHKAVVFISADYETSRWPSFEWKHIRQRMSSAGREDYVIVVRTDKTTISELQDLVFISMTSRQQAGSVARQLLKLIP